MIQKNKSWTKKNIYEYCLVISIGIANGIREIKSGMKNKYIMFLFIFIKKPFIVKGYITYVKYKENEIIHKKG